MTVAGRVDYRLAFEISPIYLTRGVAGNVAGGTLPITSLLQSNLTNLSGGFTTDVGLDRYFAHFRPLPGMSLIKQRVGEYPFANQATAANAVIRDPTTVSMLMFCPLQNDGDAGNLQAIITGLKNTLDQHNNAGGTYSINTPGYLWTDCLLIDLVDLPPGESKNANCVWQWNFRKPLISLTDAQAAQNNLTSKLSNGLAVTPNANGEISVTGVGNTVGNPDSGVGTSVASLNQSNQGLTAFAAPSSPFTLPTAQSDPAFAAPSGPFQLAF